MKRMILASVLAGCSVPQGGAPASNWDATDACTLLDKAAVGAALGDTVIETNLALVHHATAIEAATSECTYRLASGGDATLMARLSPIADNTPEAIAKTREATQSATSAFSDKPVEDVPGLGKAAFFVPGINQLNVFLDDRRFVILTVGTAPRDRARDVAMNLIGELAE